MQLTTATPYVGVPANDKEITKKVVGAVSRKHQQRQIVRVMQLTTIFLLTLGLTAAAAGHTQSVTVQAKNAPLTEVFKQIEKQTAYQFFYTGSDIKKAKRVTVQASNLPLEQVLQLVFKDQPLSYELIDKTIVVKPKEARSGDNSADETSPITNHLSLIDIRGRVTNEAGEPVAASIIVKGTNQGTTTNNDGYFELKSVDENAVLVISGVSIETREVRVNNQRELAIAATTKITSLNEVVINKGYYTEKQKYSVGNVGKVTAKDIEKQPVSNPLLALQGRVPGLFIEQASGIPGSGVKVRIQGQNSLIKGNDPLYVIDGVPYLLQNVPNFGNILGTSGSTTNGNPLSYLNPLDIESIEILKDADATAIYGSRAANGAVLITTKRGKSSSNYIEFNFQRGWGKVTRKLDLLNTNQYLEIRREALKNDNLLPSSTDYDINGFWDTNKSTDWQKELIGGTAKYLDAQLNFSGGNSSTQFLIGGNYHKETTVFPGDLSDQKGSLHTSINSTSLNQKMKVSLTINYLIDNNKLSPNDLTFDAVYLPPNAPSLYNQDGTLNWMPNNLGVSTWTNPLSYLYNVYKNKTRNLIGNSVLAYQIKPDLEIKASFGYNNLLTNEVQTKPLISTSPEQRPIAVRGAQYGTNNTDSWIVEPQLNYNKQINKARLEFLVGSTIHESRTNRQELFGSGFNSDEVLEDIKSAPTVRVGTNISTRYRYNALFARLNVNWDSRYVMNVTGRRDGSSRFGEKNQFHNFGAIGFAWLLSNEKFFQEFLSFVNFAKLRVSYGTTGNDQIGDYQFLNLYNPINVGTPYQGTPALQPNGHSNPYLQWEETRKFQTGLDINLVNDKFGISVNYYLNNSSNQLLSYSLPIVTGFPRVAQNFPATVRNYGWEAVLNSTNIKRQNFVWTSSLNFSIARNKLEEFKDFASSSYKDAYLIGHPITIIKVYEFAGVNPANGVFQFIDAKGNITSSPNSSEDRLKIINTSPDFYGGFHNSVSYKSFNLDFLFQFVKQKSQNYLFGSLPGLAFTNQPTTILDRWQKPGDIALNQRYNSNFNVATQFFNATESDKAYSDASYVRLKNVSLSWQYPNSKLSNKYLKSLQLYLHAQNLITISDFPGMDPENRSIYSLPPLKVVSIGIKCTL